MPRALPLSILLALAAVPLAPALAQEGLRAPPPPPKVHTPQLTRAPQLLEQVPAVYPPDALARGLQADVACQVDLDATGAATKVAVVKSAGPEFDAAAVAAIRQFRFLPAEIDDKPAPVTINYVYHFVIEKKSLHVEEADHPDPDAGVIEGEVLEAGNRRPIPGAEVRAAHASNQVTFADGKGRFTLRQVTPGNLRIIASAPGFAEGSEAVQLDRRGRVSTTFHLRRTRLGELSATVSGEKPHDEPTRRSLSHDELINVPGSLNDPIRAVQNLPGLARAPFLAGALLVRGSPPQDTGLYLDGDKIPLIFHFLGGPSVINEQMIDRIDFYPGGYGAYYGRNLTGALDVASRPGEGEGVHGSASVDLLQSVGFVEAPLGDSTRIAVAARRSYIDLFLPLVLPNDPKTGTTVITPVYYDYQARLDHRFANGDTFSMLAFGSDDNLALVQKGGKRNQPLDIESHIGFHRVHASYRHEIGPDLTLTIAPAAGWAVTSFTSSGAGPGTFAVPQSGNLFDTSIGLRSELRWQPSARFQLRSGIDTLIDRYEVQADIQTPQLIRSLGAPVTEDLRIDRVQPFVQWGEYVEGDLRLGDFQIVPGLRFDQVHWLGSTRPTIDPRLWVRRTLSPDTSVKAYAGLYHEPPNALQIDPQVGNPHLLPQWAFQVGLGAEHRFDQVWNASAEVFYNRTGSIVYAAKPQVLANGTIDDPLYRNSGIGRAYGLELLVRREITAQLYGWLAYTLSRSQILRRPTEDWRDFQFDQTHILTLVLGWRPSPGWDLSTRFRLVSGNPIAPVDGAVFNSDTGNFVADLGTVGDARSPAFQQLDVRAQKTWTWDLFQLAAYADVENVLNHQNEEFHVYDYRYRAQGSLSGLPILPTLGLSVRW